MYPASLVVITVMLNQLERTNQGILKMLSLPSTTLSLSGEVPGPAAFVS